MKISKGIPILTILLLFLIFLIDIYLLNFFSVFNVGGDLRNIALSFLVITIILTTFSLGTFIIFVFLQSLVSAGQYIISLSLINVFLAIITLITASNTSAWRLIFFIIFPLLALHLFILTFFLVIEKTTCSTQCAFVRFVHITPNIENNNFCFNVFDS